jgi:Peptidase E
MKKMMLVSSFKDVASIFEKFAGDVKGKTVTFIPTASVVEKVNFFVKSGRKAMEKMGLIVDELEVSTATAEEISNKLTKNDYIYITGGNTFFLLQELKKRGADKLIAEQIEFGKLYIGESAGSMVVAPNVEFAKGMDSIKKAPELDNTKSLGIVDFYPVPHYTNSPFKKAVEKIIATYGESITLMPISNHQAILIQDDDVKIESI